VPAPHRIYGNAGGDIDEDIAVGVFHGGAQAFIIDTGKFAGAPGGGFIFKRIAEHRFGLWTGHLFRDDFGCIRIGQFCQFLF